MFESIFEFFTWIPKIHIGNKQQDFPETRFNVSFQFAVDFGYLKVIW